MYTLQNLQIIKDIAEKFNFQYKELEPMKNHTTFKIGGSADMLVYVESYEQLSAVLSACDDNGIPFLILGKGSNLLISDDGIRGIVIALEGEFKKIKAEGNFITCGAGVSLSKLCTFAMENSLSGIEFAYGIPGSVGGAVFMNAGAYGGEMKDSVKSVTHMTRKGEISSYTLSELDFSYRHSVYKDSKDIILSATFAMHTDKQEDIKARMEDYMNRRKMKQPLEFPSAGSVFKRPQGNYAGTLIEKCGLKGKSVGGAMVSEKHAGFIINTGNATCDDVLSLIKLVQDTVVSQTGYYLEREIIHI